jgi:enterochelin esterase-like enzyme
MTAGSDKRANLAAQSVSVLPNAPDEPFVPPWQECLDDMTLPPGGGGRKAAEIPTPCDPKYLTAQGRDLRLDLLRGYFVVAMIIDHVRGPSPLYNLTGGNRFYTSAAEGFILVSGLVTGLVYRRLIEREGMASGLMKILARAATLYLLTIGLTLALLPISEALYLPWAQGVDLSNPMALVVSVLTLHRTYYLVDVMLLYTVLFLVAPMAFVLLDRGKSWIILLGTLLIWGLFQFFPEYAALPWPIAGNYLFNFSAWQVMFFLGLLLGYHQGRLPALSARATRVALVLTGLGTVALIAAFYIIDPPTATMPSGIAVGSPVFHEIRLWLQENFFAKVDLRPGRLLTSAITFSFLFLAASVFWPRVQKLLGWLLLPLGQHALYAYAAHIIVVTAVAILLKPFNIAYPGPQLLNMVIQIASVLIIWWMVQRQFLAPTKRTKRLWYSAPAALAVAVVIALIVFPAPSHPALAAPAFGSSTEEDLVPRRFGTPLTKAMVTGAQPAAPSGAAAPQVTPTPTIPASVLERKPHVTPEPESRLLAYTANLAGTVQERWFYSAELDAVMPYVIYLPPDYRTDRRRYPVLYMLHGRGGHRDEWLAYGLLDVADREIRTGRVPPMIIVLPQGDKWYWVNHAGDDVRWGEYVVRDLVGQIDRYYRTIRAPSARAIGGLSMGAWGALHHAFRRPDVFGVVGAHSPSLRLPDDPSVDFIGVGEEWTRKDPMALARTQPNLGSLRIWLDTAETDPWAERAEELHNILRERGVEHIWQLYDGAHEWTYWNEHAIDYVRFYGDALAQQ